MKSKSPRGGRQRFRVEKFPSWRGNIRDHNMEDGARQRIKYPRPQKGVRLSLANQFNHSPGRKKMNLFKGIYARIRGRSNSPPRRPDPWAHSGYVGEFQHALTAVAVSLSTEQTLIAVRYNPEKGCAEIFGLNTGAVLAEVRVEGEAATPEVAKVTMFALPESGIRSLLRVLSPLKVEFH